MIRVLFHCIYNSLEWNSYKQICESSVSSNLSLTFALGGALNMNPSRMVGIYLGTQLFMPPFKNLQDTTKSREKTRILQHHQSGVE